MKTLLVMILALAPMAFGQDQKPQSAVEKKSNTKTLDELADGWRKEDNQRTVKRLGENRKLTEEWLDKYNSQIATRTALTEKLKRALADGDETLIEVAVSDLNGNRQDLERSAKWAVKEEGESFLRSAKDTYRDGLITEEVYTDHLKFYRQMKAHTEEPVPTELTALIKQARAKVPDYFAILEDVAQTKLWQ